VRRNCLPSILTLDAGGAARKGFANAGVERFNLCDWHGYVSQSDALSHSHPPGSSCTCGSAFGIGGKMNAAFAVARRICYRAKDQDMLNSLIKELVVITRLWHIEGRLPSITAVLLPRLIKYLEFSLGYAGTQWERAVGDASGSSQTTNNRVESMNNQIDKVVMCGQKGNSASGLVLDKLLGRRRDGSVHQGAALFRHFNGVFDRNVAGRGRGPGGFLYRQVKGKQQQQRQLAPLVQPSNADFPPRRPAVAMPQNHRAKGRVFSRHHTRHNACRPGFMPMCIFICVIFEPRNLGSSTLAKILSDPKF